MKKTIKDRWLGALRSGEYKQGTAALKTPLGFCCLGVLCDLYIKEGNNNAEWQGTSFEEEVDEEYCGHGEDEELPDTVMKWAGLEDNDPKVTLEGGNMVNISRANDGYSGDKKYNQEPTKAHTFAEIANLIETQL